MGMTPALPCYSPAPEDHMSKINGEKARASIAKRRRTAQREKDRAARAQQAQGTGNGGSSAAAEAVSKPKKG